MPMRVFNRDQAQRMLPLVRRVCTDIKHTYEELSKLQEQIDADPESKALDAKFQMVATRFQSYITELESYGVSCTDYEEPSVAWNGILNGEFVFFHWDPSQRQDKILYFFGIEESKDARRLIAPKRTRGVRQG